MLTCVVSDTAQWGVELLEEYNPEWWRREAVITSSSWSRHSTGKQFLLKQYS